MEATRAVQEVIKEKPNRTKEIISLFILGI